MNRVALSSRRFAVLALASVFAAQALAQTPPALSSRPGAAYTLYLNFAGFNYSGTWGGGTPGVTPAYDNNGNSAVFTAGELANIKNIWSRVAEKYVAFNVNVTTVDPAVAAGQAGSDLARKNYYDSQARMMHTVIGGFGGWSGGGGVSFVGTTQGVSSNGGHTNWVFSAQAPNDLQFVGEATAHEDGHGLSLWHQSNYNGNTFVNEYSGGNGTGTNSYAPIMGVSYDSQRGTWRSGDSSGSNGVKVNQNDVQVLLNDNSGFAMVDDGKGHTLGSASTLGVIGNVVDPLASSGYIAPNNSANPNPIGDGNYTTDFFKFRATGTLVNLQLRDGSQYITPGTADPGATLKSKFRILDSNGSLVASSVLDGSTLFSTFSGNLGAGDYYLQVLSNGGFSHTGSFGTQLYYDMGSYFITGNGGITAVPEPATLAALGLGALALLRRRKSR